MLLILLILVLVLVLVLLRGRRPLARRKHGGASRRMSRRHAQTRRLSRHGRLAGRATCGSSGGRRTLVVVVASPARRRSGPRACRGATDVKGVVGTGRRRDRRPGRRVAGPAGATAWLGTGRGTTPSARRNAGFGTFREATRGCFGGPPGEGTSALVRCAAACCTTAAWWNTVWRVSASSFTTLPPLAAMALDGDHQHRRVHHLLVDRRIVGRIVVMLVVLFVMLLTTVVF